MFAAPDIVMSAAFAETATSDPANAERPIFFKLFILNTPLFLLLIINRTLLSSINELNDFYEKFPIIFNIVVFLQQKNPKFTRFLDKI
jgi:hypothetical protein